jgi:hypothetical protein
MKIFYAVILIILCTWLGIAAGELALFFIPRDTAAYTLLSWTLTSPEITRPATDLVVLVLQGTVQFRITTAGLMGTILGAILCFRLIPA